MSAGAVAVLDASALLAFLREESGEDVVARAWSEQAAISAVNWAEVLSKLADLGEDPDIAAARIHEQSTLTVYAFTEELARSAARLRKKTRSAHLSLGDRACLALGIALNLGVFTTDRAWTKLNLPVRVRNIR